MAKAGLVPLTKEIYAVAGPPLASLTPRGTLRTLFEAPAPTPAAAVSPPPGRESAVGGGRARRHIAVMSKRKSSLLVPNVAAQPLLLLLSKRWKEVGQQHCCFPKPSKSLTRATSHRPG